MKKIQLNANLEKKIKQYASVTLSDLILINQIPAPIFQEEKRADFIKKRFKEFGLKEVKRTKVGNVQGIISTPNSPDTYILVSAHLDTIFPLETDVFVSFENNRAIGAGVGDNSLGLAALLTLAEFIKKEKIILKHNIIFLATVGGEENARGMKSFLKKSKGKVIFALCLEGLGLGRIGCRSPGGLRFELNCRLVPGGDFWESEEKENVITSLAEIVVKLYSLKLPRKPKTTLNITKIEGGISYNTTLQEAALKGEVFSAGKKILAEIEKEIKKIINEASNQHKQVQFNFKIVSRRKQGHLSPHHSLVLSTKKVHSQLNISSKLEVHSNDGSILSMHNIPCLTLGISTGGQHHKIDEYINISSISLGLKQILFLVS